MTANQPARRHDSASWSSICNGRLPHPPPRPLKPAAENGRLVRRLLRNESLPTTGALPWDGVDEQGRKAAVGYYVLLVELFRPSGGERREYKKTVVLGARL